jgi:hypothetical protein
LRKKLLSLVFYYWLVVDEIRKTEIEWNRISAAVLLCSRTVFSDGPDLISAGECSDDGETVLILL